MAEPISESLHTHNEYCDGVGHIEDMVEAALRNGLTTIGISSHAPLPFDTTWTMHPSRLDEYMAEVRDLKRRYDGRIRVLLGAEVDYIPNDEVIAFQQDRVFPADFDYLIGSVHFLGADDPQQEIDGTEVVFRDILRDQYDGSIRAMVEDYYLRTQSIVDMPKVKIIGHLDRIKRWNASQTYFSGEEPWYREAVEGALQVIAASGHIVELNTSGWRNGLPEPYPSAHILKRCHALRIPITISADAHAPEQVTWEFERACTCLAELGITPVSVSLPR